MNSYRGSQTVDFLQHQLDRFLASRPSLQIEWRLLTFANAWTELIRSYKNGTPPDVFEFGTTWFSTLVRLHMLSPVPEGLVMEHAIADYLDLSRQFQNRPYAVPWTADTSCILARTDILDTLDIPHQVSFTWEEFESVCSMIMQKRAASWAYMDRAPRAITFPCRPERPTLHRISPWLWSGGFDFPSLDERPVSVMNSTAFKRGMEYIRNLMEISETTVEDARSSSYESNMAYFQQGSTVFHVSGLFETIRKVVEPAWNVDPQFPTCVIPPPSGPAGSVSYGGGSLLGVSSVTKHPDLAWEIVQALQSAELADRWARWICSLPAVECRFWEQYANHPDIQVLLHNLNHARIYPMHPMWGSIERNMSVTMSDMMWHLIDHDFDDHAQSMCIHADEELNQLLRFNWEVN